MINIKGMQLTMKNEGLYHRNIVNNGVFLPSKTVSTMNNGGFRYENW